MTNPVFEALDSQPVTTRRILPIYPLTAGLTNAAVLSIIKLPRTIGLVFMNLLPLILLSISLNAFLQTLIFWVVIGFSFTTYMEVVILKPVFAELEGDKENIKIGM